MANPPKKKKLGMTKFDPSKYIDLSPNMLTRDDAPTNRKNTVVAAVESFSPPSRSDVDMVESMKGYATFHGADVALFVAQEDVSEGYMDWEARCSIAQHAFGESVYTNMVSSYMDVARAAEGIYENLVLFVPSSLKEMISDAMFCEELDFASIDFVAVKESNEIDLINYVIEGDLGGFEAALDPVMADISEDVYTFLEHTIDNNVLSERIRPMSYSERIKKAQTMKRYANRIQMAKERAANRRASPEKIRSRARKKALDIIRSKLLQSKSYSDLSASEKQSLDKRLVNIPNSTIERIARKVTPGVKRSDNERLQRNQQRKSMKSGPSHSSPTKPTNEHLDLTLDEQFASFAASLNESDVTADTLFELMFRTESMSIDRAKTAINAEKRADEIRHRRMLDNAKRVDFNRKTAQKAAEIRKSSVRVENTDIINGIMTREADRRKIPAAVKDFDTHADELKYSNNADVTKAAEHSLAKHGIKSFTSSDLVKLSNRFAHSRSYRKAYDVFDAMESTDSPSDREWGTDSLTDKYKQMTPGQIINEGEDACMIISAAHMKAFEQFVDKMFAKYDIDFDFTKHFRDRISDPRNTPCINLKEIADTIKKIYQKYKEGDKTLSKFIDTEAVIKDLQNDLNMPIAVEYNRKNDEIEVVAKTIMRKKNFRTPNPEIKV